MLKGIREALSLPSKASASQMFVSLNVTATMRTSGLSRQSTREIIRLSVGSLLVLGLSFIVIYTIILAYVDKKLRPSSYDDRSFNYKKVKFVGKKIDSYRTSDFIWRSEKQDRNVVWNASEFYGGELLPQCKDQSLFRIIITSAPANKVRRQEIRKSWCKPENFNASTDSWQCVFLISNSNVESLNSMVNEERRLHRDILLGTFIDSYRNLTFKVVHGLYWVVKHCPSAFVVKTDDDCFVNGGVILDFLHNHNKITNNLYAGNFIMDKDRLMVIHRKDTKWSVPYEDYPYDFYPPYASGIGYILSLDSAKRFIHETSFIKPIVNEDAYVGIVMSHIHIPPTISARFLLSPSGLNVCNFLYVMITHDVHAESQMELLQTAQKSKTFCKNVWPVDTWT